MMKAQMERRKSSLLGLALMAGMVVPVSAAFACGYDSPQSISRGVLNWTYPDSLHVIGAISREVGARRLPLANFNRAGADLFGQRFRATTTALNEFAELLRAASSGCCPSARSLCREVLVTCIRASRLSSMRV